MSQRQTDGDLVAMLRGFEDRLRKVERARGIGAQLSTNQILLVSPDGTQRYIIRTGEVPGTIEIYDDVNGSDRYVIDLP